MKILQTIEWTWDFYVSRFLYNERKLHRYHRYMIQRWGEKYLKTLHTSDQGS